MFIIKEGKKYYRGRQSTWTMKIKDAHLFDTVEKAYDEARIWIGGNDYTVEDRGTIGREVKPIDLKG